MIAALAALAVMMTTAPPAEPAAVPDLSPWAETIRTLFGEAGVVEAVCGPGIRERLTMAETDVVICGDSKLPFQRFQQVWRQSITKSNKQGRAIQTVSEWELEKGIYTRTYRSAETVFGLIFTDGHAIIFNASPRKKEAPPAEGIPYGPYRLGDEDLRNPVLIYKVEPEYPELARKAGIQAQVFLAANVTPEGTVADVKVLSCTAPDLDFEAAAVKALRQWRYKPGMVNGKPVVVYFNVGVEFSIKPIESPWP